MRKDLVGTIDEIIPDVMPYDEYSIGKKVEDNVVVWKISTIDRVSAETVCKLFDGIVGDTYKIHARVLMSALDGWNCNIHLCRCGTEHVWDGGMVRNEIDKRKKETLEHESKCKKAYS